MLVIGRLARNPGGIVAHIANFGFFARLRSDASHHVISYAKGRVRRSGRGLTFWFRPDVSSLAEVPLDDRDMTLFVKGRSADFQDVNVQGVVSWRVANPEQVADRVDFTISLRSGDPLSEPIDRLEARLTGLANQTVIQHLSSAPIRKLLDDGVEPLRQRLGLELAKDPALTDIGVEVVAVRLSNLSPSSELERALQTPTFEALQQKADEAMFERRALAVEKERAIAENELSNKVELARREKLLIAEESENAQNRAAGDAAAQKIEADAEAERIRTIETANADTAALHMAAYRDLPPSVLIGMAARELAQKLEKIDQVNVTPDLVASIMRELRGGTPALTE